MNKSTLEAFMAWGDRANRDTAHMLDLAVAGTIDAISGGGTVVLRPVRLEEIASRIGPREAHPDGAWVVTLKPRHDSDTAKLPRFEHGVPQVETNTESTSEEIASMAGRILAGGDPLDNEQVLEALYQHIGSSTSRTELRAGLQSILGVYFENMLSLAGSALTQHG